MSEQEQGTIVPEKHTPERPEEAAPLAVSKDKPAVHGATELDRSDFKLPIVRIIQSGTQGAPDNADPGMFWNNVTNEVKPEIRGTIVGVRKTRLLWPPDFSRDAPVLCASDDAIRPREEYAEQLIPVYNDETGATCAECPFSQWEETAQGQEPPECNLVYKYALVDLDTGMFGLLSIKSTDIKTARSLNSLLVGGSPEIVFYTEKIEDDRGTWFAFRYRTVGKLGGEDLQVVQKLSPIARDAQVSAEMGEQADEPAEETETAGAEETEFDDSGFPGADAEDAQPSDLPF